MGGNGNQYIITGGNDFKYHYGNGMGIWSWEWDQKSHSRTSYIDRRHGRLRLCLLIFTGGWDATTSVITLAVKRNT